MSGHRSLGPVGVVLDHVCPVCNGEGGASYECICDGLGVIDEATAVRLGEPIVKLAPPPTEMKARCVDCAFRPDSPEHENFRTMEGIMLSVVDDVPFYCHQGMHVTADGRYIPHNRDAKGAPVGHPVCAGWRAARAKVERVG